jgi:hypothetical protein
MGERIAGISVNGREQRGLLGTILTLQERLGVADASIPGNREF